MFGILLTIFVLETCLPRGQKYRKRVTKFRRVSDSTISCRSGHTNAEFVTKGVFTISELIHPNSKIARDIKRIDVMNNGCLYSSCGTHVHMSHSSVTYRSHPGFDLYLLKNWIDKWQNHFIQKWYFFQNREDHEYCYPNQGYYRHDAEGKDSMFRFAQDYGIGLGHLVHFELRGLGELVGPNPKPVFGTDVIKTLEIYLNDMQDFFYDTLKKYQRDHNSPYRARAIMKYERAVALRQKYVDDQAAYAVQYERYRRNLRLYEKEKELALKKRKKFCFGQSLSLALKSVTYDSDKGYSCEKEDSVENGLFVLAISILAIIIFG